MKRRGRGIEILGSQRRAELAALNTLPSVRPESWWAKQRLSGAELNAEAQKRAAMMSASREGRSVRWAD